MRVVVIKCSKVIVVLCILFILLKSKIHYHYYTLFCLFAGEVEISRLFFSTLLFDESESDIYSLEHCEICEVVWLDNSLSDVWVVVLREDNGVRSFFIDLLTMLESDIDPLEHCEFREVIQAHNPLLDDRVETLRENAGVRS